MPQNTTLVVAVVIAIILVAVAAYYIATRPSTTTTTTTTLPPTTVGVTTQTMTSSMPPTTTTTTTSALPSGAVPLRYDASNHTVFLTVVAVSSGSPFNFNGTSSGQLHIYIPAGWTLIITFINQESIPHNVVIVQNDTATPNAADVGSDGKLLAFVGTTSSSYTSQGISSGQSASGSVTLPAGYYWLCCGILTHAESGMWAVIISSTSVTTPYAIITS
ncbi:sulfocyanin [Sulfolobus sp. SCGC AB-777_L09]|nr:sulfocyanin [Sulfolobus sp. SCGC AB-777_L09]